MAMLEAQNAGQRGRSNWRIWSGDVKFSRARREPWGLNARGGITARRLVSSTGYAATQWAIQLGFVEAIDERIVGHLFEALHAKSALRDDSKLPRPAGFQTAGGCPPSSGSGG